MKKNRTTLAEVAEVAGVSVATVSKVLNDHSESPIRPAAGSSSCYVTSVTNRTGDPCAEPARKRTG